MSTTLRLWRSGARGAAADIRGVAATIRAGYAPRLVRVCVYCGDHDSGMGWHNGRLLPQHVLTHGICKECFVDYHPFSNRMIRLERIAG